MALSTQEKDALRMVICGSGHVTPKMLADFSALTDDQVRAEITKYKARLVQNQTNIAAQIAKLG